MSMMLAKQHIQALIAVVGEKHALTSGDDQTHYTHENREIYVGKTPLVLKPGSTQEVSEVLAYCNEHEIAVVPQGGHTGHVGGAVPDESGKQVVVSLERMKAIREIDPVGNTITVEAGVILETLHKIADEHDRLFPVSIGAKGSCQIGGNISTNAGGTAVLAYGNMREQVMGLEVVLPSGEVWNGLRTLKKDNTGYDLKDLYIGAEGTLGIVTAAVLKLHAEPKGREVAFVGVKTPRDALALFEVANDRLGSSLTGFEIMPRIGMEFVVRHIEGSRDPFDVPHPWYVLIEVSSSRSLESAKSDMEALLTIEFDDGLIIDAAIAQSETQAMRFWTIRESMSWAQKPEGGSIKHDISVPVSRVPEFLDRAAAIIVRELPGSRICAFGHLGDGNIHYNISQPEGGNTEAFLSHRLRINDLIHALVVEMNGSISAEHGIGQLKRDMLAAVKSETEMNLMRTIKKALDPKGIMNPGKVL